MTRRIWARAAAPPMAALLGMVLGTAPGPAALAETCTGYGPQAPRDISSPEGLNQRVFGLAAAPEQMNLCDIHTHTNAEHKGPGFRNFAGATLHGGYQCNNADQLSDAELTPASGAYKAVKPGDTIEVHWVYTSCDVEPAPGLGSCFSKACTNGALRVESQVFVLVNDADALDFANFTYAGQSADGYHRAGALPTDTGAPVVFAGSTTGPDYTATECSPFQVTWSVRPNCAKLDINSLHRWGAGNVFEQVHSHGVRQLVTAPELLAPMQ